MTKVPVGILQFMTRITGGFLGGIDRHSATMDSFHLTRTASRFYMWELQRAIKTFVLCFQRNLQDRHSTGGLSSQSAVETR